MCSPLLQITAHPLPLLLLPGQVALCKLACIGHNHTQLRSSVLALMPLLLRCLIEPAQLFAPPLLNNLTCCFQMHSALRPLLWGWCAGLTDAINKVIHYNFLLFYLNYTTRLVLSHSAHQHWFCIASMQLEAAHKKHTHIKNKIVWLKQQLWSGIFHCFVALDIWYLTLLLFPILIAVITLRFHILGRLWYQCLLSCSIFWRSAGSDISLPH